MQFLLPLILASILAGCVAAGPSLQTRLNQKVEGLDPETINMLYEVCAEANAKKDDWWEARSRGISGVSLAYVSSVSGIVARTYRNQHGLDPRDQEAAQIADLFQACEERYRRPASIKSSPQRLPT